MKIKVRAPGEPPSSVPSTPAIENPPPAQIPATSGKPRIKLKSSQPPTPAGEYAPPLAVPLGPPPTKTKRAYVKKPKPDGGDDASKKRPANDDINPTAPKRPVISFNPSRRNSIKQEPAEDELALTIPTPTSATAGPKISLKAKRNASLAERKDSKARFSLTNRKAAPPKRPVGVGYDSEASDAEPDPLIENQFVLRMQPSDDCDYLRDAITNKTLGMLRGEGGADVNMRFLDKENRRLILSILGHNYAAAMVDLPCIIEGMKSWDKRGWWKVADICQMLLVLGPTESDDTAKAYPLPKEVDKKTWAYAHGLTPPMHYVRKRRFRQRASYKTVEHIDEEVERLLALDKEADSSTYKVIDDGQEDAATALEDDYDDEEAPDNYIDTTEDTFGQAYPDEEDAAEDEHDLAADLMLAMEEGEDDADADADDDNTTTAPPSLPLADAAANLGAVESVMASAANPLSVIGGAIDTSSTAAPTPAPEEEGEEGESDEDESSDEDASDSGDSPTAIDEDLVERERELEGQRQDIEELEKRIQQAKMDIATQKNPLLKQRKMKTLRDLEEELGVKKRALGMGEDDDDDDE